jgi:choline-sulfatase
MDKSSYPNKPNIVLLISDQHRADWMGCSGSRYVHTPNLDQLASGGVRFAQTYCNSPFCVPSRMSMLAGRHPYRTQVWSNEHQLASDIPTFAHGLGIAGYETVLCGRMHFKGPDQRHGYETRLVGDITPTYNGGPTTPYGPLKGSAAQGMKSLECAGPGDSPVLRYDEAVTAACESFLAERSRFLDAAPQTEASQTEASQTEAAQANAPQSQATPNPQRPLFLTVGWYGPHPTFICPPDLYEQAATAMNGEEGIPKDEEPLHPWVKDWFRRLNIDSATKEQIAVVRASYAGLINRLDQLVGRVVEAAKSLPGETYIVYLSDHGEMAGDHGMFWKQSFYEGSSRVPLIWCHMTPSTPSEGETATRVESPIAAGITVDVPVSLVDLAPTLVSLAGAPSMPGQDGRDLTPLLRGGISTEDQKAWEERPVFCELLGGNGSPRRMVRWKQYKLNYYDDFPPQLFDLRSDPYEQRDLLAQEEYGELIRELTEMLFAHWDPEQIKQTFYEKNPDLKYLARWGQTVGFGRMDMWDSSDTNQQPN